MRTQALGVRAGVLLLFFSIGARAQSSGVDDFDMGDEWVDSSSEGGWYAPWTPVLAPDTGGFRLDLSGGIGSHTQRQGGQESESGPARFGARQNYYALATLEVPLDRIFSIRSGYGESRSPREDAPMLLAQHVDAASEQSEAARNKPRVNEASPASKNPPAVSRSEGDAEKVARARGEQQSSEAERGPHLPAEGSGIDGGLEVLAPEVTLLIAREIADRAAPEFASAVGRIRSLIRRSRFSGLSPELRLRGVLGFDRATSTEESVGIYPGDTTVRGGRDSLAEARLTFRLDRLVLGDGEASLERQRTDLLEERRQLISEALEIFSDWRRSSVRAKDLSLPPDERVEATIDAEKALAELHLFTDGWFQGEVTIRKIAQDVPSSGRTRHEARSGR